MKVLGIGKVEWHHKPLIQTPFGLGCGLPFITHSNADLLVFTPSIHLREHTRAVELIQHTLKPWDRMPILYGDLVDYTAIHAHVHTPIFLKDKKSWDSTRAQAFSHQSLGNQLIYLPLYLHDLFRIHPIGWFVRQNGSRNEVYVVLDGSLRRQPGRYFFRKNMGIELEQGNG